MRTRAYACPLSPGTMELLKGVPIHPNRHPEGIGHADGRSTHYDAIAGIWGYATDAARPRRIRCRYPLTLNNVQTSSASVSAKKTADINSKTTHHHAETDNVDIIETNVDDMSPEITGYVTSQLFEHGALDCLSYPHLHEEG